MKHFPNTEQDIVNNQARKNGTLDYAFKYINTNNIN